MSKVRKDLMVAKEQRLPLNTLMYSATFWNIGS